MIRNWIRYAALAGVVVALGACGEKELTVTNPNNADTKRVLDTPADVESLLGTYYKRWHSAMYVGTTNVWGMASVQSFENYSTLSNNCMAQRVGIPRPANDNTVGNGCFPEQAKVYTVESEVEHVASTIIAQLNGGLTLGSDAQNNRAIAFGQFERGLALGYLAMVYDSAAIVTPDMMAKSASDPGVLVGYPDVMAASLDALQKAIDATNAGAASFPLPGSWIPSSTTFTATEFIKLIRSYRARFRADVARTPTERAAVDWTSVIADAQNGITVDHDNITSTTNQPNDAWVSTWYSYGTWSQMTPFVIGMADTSGAYAAWIGQSLSNRGSNGSFFMVTPDLRFPQGETRAAQQADFALAQCSSPATKCKRYFVNRDARNDPSAAYGWGASNYDHARFYSWSIAGDAGSAQNGKFPFFTKAELDMLEAEGLIRTGNYAAAAALINKTRVANGLPAITAFDNATPVPGGTAANPVPGGSSCVPRVPLQAAAQGSGSGTQCGNMMEAMKYEKRIEEMFTNFMDWYLDERGWGDLPQGTGVDWAVPYSDLLARQHPVYSKGGGTLAGSAALGTYGW
jgi:hypothetical protein